LTILRLNLKVIAMKITFSAFLGLIAALLAAPVGWAQSIVGEGTTNAPLTTNVPPAGVDIFNISGGETAGTNLFHSFTRFGLSANEVAIFQIGNPAIQNVFSRVTGGNPSVINGILQSNGGASPNFYFMNPAGIVFGPNFSLNIPGAFTATTANGIGFGSNWFSATGANNVATLLGDPTAFGFTMAQPAAMINNAALTSNKSLTLIAGTIVSPGALTLSDGTLTIAAVPGNSLVRVTSAGTILGLEIRPFQVAETQPNALVAAVPNLAQLVTGPAPGGGTIGDATGVSVNPDGSLTLTGAGMSIRPGDVQVAALEGNGVLVGAPAGNVVVDTILSRDLGIDITAGKLFQATKTFAPSEYRSLFQELLTQPDSELMAFLKLQTGLSDADLISKYPGGLTLPHANFPTLASIFVRRGIMPGNANVVIRHGGSSQLDLQGRSGATVMGAAPFSVGGQVTLDAPGDLANRYSFVNPAQTFANLAASTPGGAIESQDGVFDLRRNQSTTAIPIPTNSSGTVGAIVQTVRGDGGLTVSFANQLFGSSLPANPANPGSPGTPTPTTSTISTNSPTNPTIATPTSPDSGAIANAQQGGERSSAVNNTCPSTVGRIARTPSRSSTTDRRSAVITDNAGCAVTGDDDAILKILE
jgi:filamentous hemagglutinin family protein